MLTLPGFAADPNDSPLTDKGEVPESTERIAPGVPKLIPGDVAPYTLYMLMSGEPAVVIASPPGAGKSTLLTVVASNAVHTAELTIGIACQRNGQAEDLARKFGVLAPDVPVFLVGSSKSLMPKDLPENVEFTKTMTGAKGPKGPGVIIATSAKWAWTRKAKMHTQLDMLFIDEAWQLTWAGFSTIAGLAPQYLLVGDPGQIDPVVTADTSRWVGRKVAPQLPCPTVLQHRRPDDVLNLRLPNTRRNGPDIAHVINPLYTFDFGSARADRTLIDRDGNTLTEAAITVTDGHGSVDDPALLDAIAARVEWLLANARYRNEHGEVRDLTQEDIAVVCARNVQVAGAMARLAHLPEVTVGTNDSLQGGEWLATVMLSPLAGVRVPSSFEADLGRMCVGLSRHIAHVTLVERHDTRDCLAAAKNDLPGDTHEVLTEVLDRLDQCATILRPTVRA